MKEILLVRHAKSSWDHPELRDFDRSLNNRGRKDLPIMANLLKKVQFMPEAVFSSPALRTRITARTVCEVIGFADDKIQWEQEIYASSVSYLLKMIRSIPNEINKIVIFGHNPEFTELVNYLNKIRIENVPTTGMILLQTEKEKWVQIEKNCAKISFFLFPKLFNDKGEVREEKRNYIYLPKILRK
jgi:phosphohistidine phosphatase